MVYIVAHPRTFGKSVTIDGCGEKICAEIRQKTEMKLLIPPRGEKTLAFFAQMRENKLAPAVVRRKYRLFADTFLAVRFVKMPYAASIRNVFHSDVPVKISERGICISKKGRKSWKCVRESAKYSRVEKKWFKRQYIAAVDFMCSFAHGIPLVFV